MNGAWNESIWQQFGAAIDMLEMAVRACPQELWRESLWEGASPAGASERREYSEFWFVVYHTLKWLDLYLDGTAEGFAPPDYLQRYEKDEEGVLPRTPYTKEDLQTYLGECREKCRTTIGAMTEESALQPCRFDWIHGEINFLALQLYNMRHVQEHAAQLSMLLGQKAGTALDWVEKAGGSYHADH